MRYFGGIGRILSIGEEPSRGDHEIGGGDDFGLSC